MLRSLNRRLSRTDEWVALNVVELNSACASRRLTTNLGVGRSNRSGRATVSRSPCFLGIIRQFNSFVLPHWYQAVGSMVCVGMGLIKNEHGVYHVRRKVPKHLEEATATVMGVSKLRVSWLKETLGTKDEKQARVRAKPVMMKFDGILAKAEALLVDPT